MRLRSQKTITPCAETPRSKRRPSNKATPRRTRLTVTESSPQPKVTNYGLIRFIHQSATFSNITVNVSGRIKHCVRHQIHEWEYTSGCLMLRSPDVG